MKHERIDEIKHIHDEAVDAHRGVVLYSISIADARAFMGKVHVALKDLLDEVDRLKDAGDDMRAALNSVMGDGATAFEQQWYNQACEARDAWIA